MALFSESLQNHKLYRLLRRLAEGDETAMDELYRDYSGFIYFHIMNMTDNKSIAEEIRRRFSSILRRWRRTSCRGSARPAGWRRKRII